MPESNPPYTITPTIIRLIVDIAELIGRYSSAYDTNGKPRLRKGRRIQTIQASLAIENNTLSLEQVTAILDGKRVLGLPAEIQEVRNAFTAYESMEQWNPTSIDDLLTAHNTMMAGLVDKAGNFRNAGTGIFKGKKLIHMAPPANRVHYLIDELLSWLKHKSDHPLITSCVFHYEFEFIHPFADGNGRLGRLWQTLILSKWKPIFAYIPIECIINDRQKDYYACLARSDHNGNSTAFVEFLLKAIYDALKDVVTDDQVSDQVSEQVSDQVSEQVSDQVIRILNILNNKALSSIDIMHKMQLSHRPAFRKKYIKPALKNGFIEMTQPDSPKSPTQKYRITLKGLNVMKKEI
ncbi:cell division protein Fic [Candidatus Magnetomorum sp. HK-1]|nr:cell division protein Fic [Candidatus Magnetomorum sp. HK-1]